MTFYDDNFVVNLDCNYRWKPSKLPFLAPAPAQSPKLPYWLPHVVLSAPPEAPKNSSAGGPFKPSLGLNGVFLDPRVAHP
jgi:hypothetical protein